MNMKLTCHSISTKQYNKRGLPFQVRNLVDPDSARIFLPLKYLGEIKAARPDRLNFFEILCQHFLLRYTQAPIRTETVLHFVKHDLAKSIGDLTPSQDEEVNVGLASRLPKNAGMVPYRGTFLL